MNFSRQAPIMMLLTVLFAVSNFLALARAASRAEVCEDVRKCLELLDQGKECEVIRTPDEAMISPFLDVPFELSILRKGVWLYRDGTYLALLLRRGSRLVVIDIPDAPSSSKPDGSKTKLTDAAEQVMDGTAPGRIDIIYSHEHYDHMGGAGLFVDYMKKKHPAAKIEIWGTEATKRMIENSVTKKAPIPTVIVGANGKTLSLGKGLKVQLDIVGGHAQEDLLIYIPKSGSAPGIVMYVDVVFPKYVPGIDLATAQSVGQYLQAQKDILKLDFEIFVGGHVVQGTRKDVEENVEYTEDLIQAALTAIETVGDKELEAAGLSKFLDPSAREFGNNWFFLARVANKAEQDACYRILLPKWGCRLAGLDIMARGHCFTAVSYVYADY